MLRFYGLPDGDQSPSLRDATFDCASLMFGEIYRLMSALGQKRTLFTAPSYDCFPSARARGRKGGRRPKMTSAKLRLAMSAMGKPETNVGELCRELGITRSTLYRHVSPTGELRGDGLQQETCAEGSQTAETDEPEGKARVA
jgi:transposase-like protein